MKKILLSFIIIITAANEAFSQGCAANCTLYTVQNIPVSIVPMGGNFVSLGDDQLSGNLNIGFTFTFYCTARTQFKISSNGFITFDPFATNSGCCSGGFIPGAGTPNDQIAWSWNDLNPGAGGQISYQTIGTAPNRICVITWSNVPHFGGGGGGPNSGQIKLFETSNTIEVHNAQVTSDGSNCTQGIENAAGNIAVPAPGRNGAVWTANNDARQWTVSGGGPQTPGAISGNVNACPGTSYVYSVTPIAGASQYNWTLPGGWTGTSTTNTIMVTPSSTGVLSVSATYTCGTSPNATLNITMNPNPVVSISGGASPVCPGTNVSLTGSGASTYLWSTGAGGTMINVTPTISTQYSVVGTSAAGCTASAIQVVTVNPSPAVSISGNPASFMLCQGSTIFLTASGASTYTWSTGSNSPNISDNPATTTTYSVTGSIGTCPGTAAVIVTVNPLPIVTIAGSNTLCAGQPLSLIGSGADTYVWVNTGATSAAISETPMVNTIYTLSGTSTLTGCQNTAVHSVTVNTAPSLTVTGPYAMCLNQTITLAAYGAVTYSWNTGATSNSIAISPTANISYSVYGTSALGCQGPPFVKNITVNDNPTVTIAPTATFLCKGQTATLTANGAHTYSWSPGGQLTTSIIVTPTANANYSVAGTNTTTGCYTGYSLSIVVSPCTGVNNNSSDDVTLMIYPNPNQGEFVIELNNGQEKRYEVLDVVGRIILSGSSENDMIDVSIKDFSSGVYYVRVQSASFFKVVRVVKE